jgi:hypothetical protein
VTDWSELNASTVSALAKANEAGEGFSIVWPNVLWTARQFWIAQSENSEDRRIETWHHVVMSAGNFKRPGGTQISLLRLPRTGELDLEQLVHPDSCVVYTKNGTLMLRRDDLDTWIRLTEQVSGLSVATTTTLLSALWPGHHVIADLLDVSVAMALNMDEAIKRSWIRLDAASPTPMGWETYAWFRSMVLAKSIDLSSRELAIRPVDVEPALYTLGQRANDAKHGENLSWNAYSELVETMIHAI